MIAVSNDFKTVMKQPIKELDAYIELVDSSKITSADDLISFKISCDSGMCKTAMRKLEAKYLGEHNLLGQWVHVGYGVKLPTGAFEYLDYGSFLVTEITTVKDTGVTTIVGYDQMVNSMKEYTKLEVEYPMSLLDYTKLLCNACNLDFGNDIFGYNLCNGINQNYYLNNDVNTIGNNSGDTGLVISTNGATTFTILSNISQTRYRVACVNELPTDNQRVTAYNGKNLDGTNQSVNIDTTNYKYLVVNATDLNAIQITKGNYPIDYRPYNNMNEWQITQELWENINGITYRDILVQIAQATGSTCIISNDDKVYFKPINNTGEQLTYDNMKKWKLEPIYGEINSVILARTPQEDNIFMRDEESIKNNGLTEYKIANNEIVDKDRDNAMTPIYNALYGISYYPFEITTEGLGWYEIADNFDIVNDTGDVFNTSLFNFSITIDGGIKEILKTVADTKTQTQYQYATTIAKRVKNTEIVVDKQGQNIKQLVTDMYEEDGIINENFTNVYQDIHNIINSVQNSGGNNLIKNSVMFAYDDNGVPNNWLVDNGGINKFNTKDIQNGYYHTNGNLTVGDTNWYYVIIPALANTQYTFSGVSTVNSSIGIIEFNEKKEYIQCALSYKNDSFITSNKTSFLGLCCRVVDINSIQLELGNQATKHTDYISNSLVIQSSAEALANGSLSGHTFKLLNTKVKQRVQVKADSGTDTNKVYYSFSTKIKKDATGTCYVKLYNSNEEHIISIPAGESVFYKEYEIKALLPKDNYYDVEFYGSADSNATFTDNMLAIGQYKTQWQQANGEVMNTQVNINLEGVLIKSSVYLGDYTVMSPLEFAGYSNINGTVTKVFSLNKDTTLVKKLEAEDEVKMVPIKIVPVTSGDLQGWAFVPST